VGVSGLGKRAFGAHVSEKLNDMYAETVVAGFNARNTLDPSKSPLFLFLVTLGRVCIASLENELSLDL